MSDVDAHTPTERSQPPSTVPKLSGAQRRVLAWIGHGWTTESGGGAAVNVNGQRVCNTDTMMALHRAGLATRDEHGSWCATAAGKSLTSSLHL